MCKNDNDRNKVASDHVSIAKEEVLITMSCFLSGHTSEHWDKHCNVLKKPNDISGHSGFISHHMEIIYYLMNNDLKHASDNIDRLDGFKTFLSRKNMHANDEKTLLHEELPKKIFDDA